MSAQGHRSISVPPDVLRARRENTTASMLSQLQSPSSNADPRPFKGIGFYTDVEVTVPQNDPRVPQQQYAVPKFLPLGGPHHMQNTHRKNIELPDEVVSVYGELKAILLQEEAAEKNGRRKDPGKRFQCLGLPKIMIPLPPLPRSLELVSEPAVTHLRESGESREGIILSTQERGKPREGNIMDIKKPGKIHERDVSGGAGEFQKEDHVVDTMGHLQAPVLLDSRLPPRPPAQIPGAGPSSIQTQAPKEHITHNVSSDEEDVNMDLSSDAESIASREVNS